MSWYLNFAPASTLLFQLVVVSFILLIVAIIAFDRTDVPHIKILPAVPGLPIFGSLIQLGQSHPIAYQKLARKYGPVYQIRLGNKAKNDLDSRRSEVMLIPCRDLSSPTHSTRSASYGYRTSLR